MPQHAVTALQLFPTLVKRVVMDGMPCVVMFLRIPNTRNERSHANRALVGLAVTVQGAGFVEAAWHAPHALAVLKLS